MQKHLENIIDVIDQIQVDKNNKLFSPDFNQVSLSEKKKADAKNLILDVVNQIDSYVKAIQEMKNLKGTLGTNEGEGSIYRKDMENIDRKRRLSHNALISSINAANRFISRNFGKINEELIEEWEEVEEKAGRKILYVKRIQFPPNIICTDNIDLSDRNQIKDWAMQLSKVTSEIRKKLL